MNIKSQKTFFRAHVHGRRVAFAWGATTYNVGSGARMGPGYFPLYLGLLMVILGAVITFKALVVEAMDGGKIGKWAWKPLFFVILANLVFGALLAGFLNGFAFRGMGLIIAIYALVFIASMAESGWRFKPTFILATILAAGSYVAFVLALKLQFPVWPAFITG